MLGQRKKKAAFWLSRMAYIQWVLLIRDMREVKPVGAIEDNIENSRKIHKSIEIGSRFIIEE